MQLFWLTWSTAWLPPIALKTTAAVLGLAGHQLWVLGALCKGPLA